MWLDGGHPPRLLVAGHVLPTLNGLNVNRLRRALPSRGVGVDILVYSLDEIDRPAATTLVAALVRHVADLLAAMGVVKSPPDSTSRPADLDPPP